MKAFLISVNGKKVALAGVDGDGVLNAMVTLSRGKFEDRLDMEVGGMYGDTDEQVIWPSPEIGVGDEIVIRVVEADTVDDPMD